RRPEALAALKKALEYEPRCEMVLFNAAALAQRMDRLDEAQDYWRRAIEMNPWQPQYRAGLAILLMQKEDLPNARVQIEEWLKLDPANVEGRKLWVQYWLRAGSKEKAAEAFAVIEALNPPNLSELKAWYVRQQR